MKSFVQAAGIFLIFVLAIILMANIFSKSASDTELENALEKALEHSLYVAMTDNVYTIDDTDELAADVMHELFTTCNVKADYTIVFNVIDIENGLVDVEVTQVVQPFPLIKSEVKCRKTIILEIAADSGSDGEGAAEPVLAANNSWWTSSSDKSAINTIYVLDEYAGEGSESWPAGVDRNADGKNDDDVMCYLDDSGQTLRIVGNGFGRIYANPDSTHAFEGFTSLEAIEGFDIFDTSKATNTDSMFKNCYTVKALDLSEWDTSKITDMGMMFFHCRALTDLDISGFDTANVTNMSGMFSGCYVMTSFDLSHFDTSNVTDMSGMFSACHGLTSVNLSSFVTANVTDMDSMFAECNSLPALNLSNFVTAKVTNMSSMFDRCSSLASLNVTSFDNSNVEFMGYMFHACEKLTSLDLSSFDTSNVEDTEEMFYWCNSLKSILARTDADKAKFELVGNSVPEGCTVTVKAS